MRKKSADNIPPLPQERTLGGRHIAVLAVACSPLGDVQWRCKGDLLRRVWTVPGENGARRVVRLTVHVSDSLGTAYTPVVSQDGERRRGLADHSPFWVFSSSPRLRPSGWRPRTMMLTLALHSDGGATADDVDWTVRVPVARPQGKPDVSVGWNARFAQFGRRMALPGERPVLLALLRETQGMKEVSGDRWMHLYDLLTVIKCRPEAIAALRRAAQTGEKNNPALSLRLQEAFRREGL